VKSQNNFWPIGLRVGPNSGVAW